METRTLQLKNIILPIRVMHEHLDSNERVDKLSNRIDRLEITVDIIYKKDKALLNKTFDGALNYKEIYQHLCLSDLITVTGPLEGLLDDVVLLTEKIAKQQNISLLKVTVSANRMGLIVGHPRLMVSKTYEKEQFNMEHSSDILMKREVGVEKYPILANINYIWSKEIDQIEYVPSKYENLILNIKTETIAKKLNDDNLNGLYNYSGLINKIEMIKDIEFKGTVEQIADKVSVLIEEEALRQGVELLKIEVEIERTELPRCTPVIGLKKYIHKA